MTKLIMKRAVRRSNDLESPENSRTSQGDTDVSSLVKRGESKTTDPDKSDSGKSDLNLNLNSYEPSNYFGSGQSGPAETNPKVITETPVLSPSVDPQATPEDTAQEPTEKG